MQILVLLGGVLVAAGLVGLGYCIRTGFAIRRARPDPDMARARLNQLLAVNFASVGLAALGLALLVAGFMI